MATTTFASKLSGKELSQLLGLIARGGQRRAEADGAAESEPRVDGCSARPRPSRGADQAGLSSTRLTSCCSSKSACPRAARSGREWREDDSVVKLRPVVLHELPKALRLSQTFNIEIDVLPSGFDCSCLGIHETLGRIRRS